MAKLLGRLQGGWLKATPKRLPLGTVLRFLHYPKSIIPKLREKRGTPVVAWAQAEPGKVTKAKGEGVAQGAEEVVEPVSEVDKCDSNCNYWLSLPGWLFPSLSVA